MIAQLFGLALDFVFESFVRLRIPTGPKGFIVFDLLLDHGVEDECDFVCGGGGGSRRAAIRSIALMLAHNWKPKTYSVVPGSGQHLYFRHPAIQLEQRDATWAKAGKVQTKPRMRSSCL